MSKTCVCTNCHAVGEPKDAKIPIGLVIVFALIIGVSFLTLPLGITLCLAVVALLFILIAFSRKRCAVCDGQQLVPVDSPRGKQIAGV